MNFSTTAEGRISREMTAIRKLKTLNLACLEKTWNPLMNRIKTIRPSKKRVSVKIEKLETGSAKNVVGIPNYSYFSTSQNLFIWRDLYTYGFIDSGGLGVDYPFLNGTHYPSTKIIFRLFPEGNVPEQLYAIADPDTDDCE